MTLSASGAGMWLGSGADTFGAVFILLVSCLDELGVFEDDCFLWWVGVDVRPWKLAMVPIRGRRVVHDRHVQALR